jgi:hypothetical protein
MMSLFCVLYVGEVAHASVICTSTQIIVLSYLRVLSLPSWLRVAAVDIEIVDYYLKLRCSLHILISSQVYEKKTIPFDNACVDNFTILLIIYSIFCFVGSPPYQFLQSLNLFQLYQVEETERCRPVLNVDK